VYGGDGNDVLLGRGDADALYGDAGNDYLDGGDGNDVLSGGVGDDVLVGGAGDDLAGGDGNDTYVYSAGGVYQVSETNGNDTLVLAEGIGLADMDFDERGAADLFISIAGGGGIFISNQFLGGVNAVERLVFADGRTLGLSDIQFGTGSSLTGTDEDSILMGYSSYDTGTNDILISGGGNDWLNGGVGSDTMTGGTGNDFYFVDNRKDIVNELANQGTDTVASSMTYTLGSNVEDLILTGSSSINGTGNALNNVLVGNGAGNTLNGGAGNDWLDGGGGADSLVGGTGDDTYVVDMVNDKITERANEGTDTVLASATYTLSSNVENLTLTGMSAINGTGNKLDNVLKGNTAANALSGVAGNDILDGGAGDDTLTGGTGNDTYILGRGYGVDTVVENDTTSGNTDIAQFLSGTATDQIWFSKSANNLEVSVIGTEDKLVIKDWYLSSAYHVEQFKTADGKTLLDSQVANLVNTMASFTPPAAGQTVLSQNYQDALGGVIAANWQ
jgi:Ca2+-binding RTX toxin-like protein